MNDESETRDTEHEKEGSRSWEVGFGGRRFRAQWERKPGRAWFHFQGPFIEQDDPDGFGTPFAPDFGLEWRQGEGTRAYGEYEEHLEELREKTERTARRAAERARRYAQRATRRMRDSRWEALEHDLLAAVEKATAELEGAFARMRRELSKSQAESGSPTGVRGPRAQRVPIEYDKVDDPLDEDASAEAADASASLPLTREERDARRRLLLEELRTGAISIAEAEQRLNDLGW